MPYAEAYGGAAPFGAGGGGTGGVAQPYGYPPGPTGPPQPFGYAPGPQKPIISQPGMPPAHPQPGMGPAGKFYYCFLNKTWASMLQLLMKPTSINTRMYTYIFGSAMPTLKTSARSQSEFSEIIETKEIIQ